MQRLKGRVAVVAGATRGAGRGIARMLGEAGATVYCTGRSSRSRPNTSSHHYAGRPETIEETAELVDTAGGAGIAVRVDHTADAEVAALFERVAADQGRLDVLVNVLTGPPVWAWEPFWKLAPEKGRELVDSWIWPHVTTAHYAAQIMAAQKSGLMVEIVEQHTIGYHGQFYFDMFEAALKRSVYAMAEELGPKGVAAVAVTPGFMRTEAILEGFGATEATWREVAETNPRAKQFGFAGSETPCFVGRAVAALAADPDVLAKSGGIYGSWTLSEEYGFDDVDGARPNSGRYMREHFPHLFDVAPNTGLAWKVERVGAPKPPRKKRGAKQA